MACGAIDKEQNYRIYKLRQHHFETAGNMASGTGDYELANMCWSYAARMKKRAQESIKHMHGDKECVVFHADLYDAEDNELREVMY